MGLIKTMRTHHLTKLILFFLETVSQRQKSIFDTALDAPLVVRSCQNRVFREEKLISQLCKCALLNI